MTKNTRQPEKKRYYKQIAFILMIVMIAALAQASYAGGSRVATEKVARSAPVAEPADAGSASGKSHIPEKPPETGSASEKPHAPDEPPESGSAPEQTPDEPPESGSVPKEPSAPEQGAQNEGDDKNIPADAAAGHDAGQTPASGPAGS
ncbi:MAG: hypothetical protein LBT52_06385, partial [Clostridiales Family XIII bacterium]|nr:hypothetical protein [Clostridiales Family XIII bacterium]